MSLAGKLISAALTIGTAAAVGYGLKKLEEKVKEELTPPEEKAEREIIGTADSKIRLHKQSGDEWKYSLSQKGVVRAREVAGNADAPAFDFVPLGDGVCEIEFDYYPQGAQKSAKTVTYTIEVKDGNIIRCDAAGDLEMLVK